MYFRGERRNNTIIRDIYSSRYDTEAKIVECLLRFAMEEASISRPIKSSSQARSQHGDSFDHTSANLIGVTLCLFQLDIQGPPFLLRLTWSVVSGVNNRLGSKYSGVSGLSLALSSCSSLLRRAKNYGISTYKCLLQAPLELPTQLLISKKETSYLEVKQQ